MQVWIDNWDFVMFRASVEKSGVSRIFTHRLAVHNLSPGDASVCRCTIFCYTWGLLGGLSMK